MAYMSAKQPKVASVHQANKVTLVRFNRYSIFVITLNAASYVDARGNERQEKDSEYLAADAGLDFSPAKTDLLHDLKAVFIIISLP